jgi:hypothetical protein
VGSTLRQQKHEGTKIYYANKIGYENTYPRTTSDEYAGKKHFVYGIDFLELIFYILLLMFSISLDLMNFIKHSFA